LSNIGDMRVQRRQSLTSILSLFERERRKEP